MRSISLRIKFLAGAIGIVLLMGMTMIVLVKTTLYKQLHEKLEKRGVSIARSMAHESINPILTRKFFELEMLVKDFKGSEDDIEYIFVLDSHGEVLAHTFEKGFPVDLKKLNTAANIESYRLQHLESEKGRIHDIAVPLLKGRIGVVHLGFSEEPLRRGLNEIIRLIMYIIAAILVIGSIAAIVFSTAITKPVLELLKGVKALGSGNLDARISVIGDDEIGQLGSAFNDMVEKRRQAEEELRDALAKINTLRGLIPICASCKKIRDDHGFWNSIEKYIMEHSEAEFSHGICPDCAKRLYPEYYKEFKS